MQELERSERTGLLTDSDLRLMICDDKDWVDKNKIHIYPYAEDSLTPVGYDVRVGSMYASAFSAELLEIGDDDYLEVRPGDTVLITTLETVSMPRTRLLSAFITSKVSKVSKGLSHISTNVDPDWEGELLIAIHNPSSSTVRLKHGEALCTINFIENKSPSTKDCGKKPGRTDILLGQFVADAKKSRQREKSYQRKVYGIRASIIAVSVVAGYLVFKNSAGLTATTAMGIALATQLHLEKRG